MLCIALQYPDAFSYVSQLPCRSDWTYGALPREAVCTENLTPWLRLLPCRGAAGLAALLHGPVVFSSPYTSLTASLTAVTLDRGSITQLRLAQTLTVLLPARAAGDWSLRSLFGDDARGACPLATRSSVHVQLPWDGAEQPASTQKAAQHLGLSPAPAGMRLDGGAVVVEYPLPTGPGAAPLTLEQKQQHPTAGRPPAAEAPALAVHR